MNKKMKIMLDKGAIMPIRAHVTDAGIDLMTPVDFFVPAHGYAFVDTGLHVQLPPNTRGHVCSKSGLNKNHGITTDGTIDEGYTGSIGVTLHNDNNLPYMFKAGQKIAQLVVEPILRPELVLAQSLDESERGENGFGSTGE